MQIPLLRVDCAEQEEHTLLPEHEVQLGTEQL